MSETEAIEMGARFLVRWRGKGFHSPTEIEAADAQAVKEGDRVTMVDSGQQFIAGPPRRDPDDGLVTTPLLPVPPTQQ
jgi:hypothetical protein